MTNHEDLYRRRLTSPELALRDLPKRCSVLLGIFAAQPPALVQALADRAKAGEIDEHASTTCMRLQRRSRR
jgi:itaconate CoA-transferase